MPLPAILRRVLTKLVMNYDQPDLLKRIVTGFNQTSITYNVLENPDEALKHFAPVEQLPYYRRVRRQLGYVAGIVKLRVDAEMALPHVWVASQPNDPESVDWCEGVKQAWDSLIDRDQALRKMMFCVADGLTIGEYVWGLLEVAITVKPDKTGTNQEKVGELDRVEDWVVPLQIIDLNVEKFQFDLDLQLRFKPNPGDIEGELIDPMKVVVARFGSAQPWGEGEMRDICQDAWKLDWIDRKGLEALEREGYPLAQITVPELWDENRVRSTLAWANLTYKNFMIVRMGDRFEISFPAQTVRPTYIGQDQVTRIKQIQDDISVGYLGVSFSNASQGSKARDQVRNEMRFEKTSSDSAVFDSIANDFERKIRMVNRPGLAEFKRAKMVTDYKPTEDVASRSNVYVQAVGIGYPASQKQFGEEFGLRPALNEKDKLQKVVVPAGAGIGKGPQNKPAMQQNITSPASNDNPDTNSVSTMSDRQHRLITVAIEGGSFASVWEDQPIPTQRGLLYADELMDGDTISQFALSEEGN